MIPRKYGVFLLAFFSVAYLCSSLANVHNGRQSSTQPFLRNDRRRSVQQVPARVRPHLLVVSIPDTYETGSYKNAWNASVFIDRDFSTLSFDISTDKEYPPFNHNFDLWQKMQSLPDKYTWYTRCDYDTYLNGRKLRTLLEGYDPLVPRYLGSIGHGRREDIVSAHIDFPFVMGGGCETVNHAALSGLNLASCRAHSVTLMNNRPADLHSDVEFGRCLQGRGVAPTNLRDQGVANSMHYVHSNKLSDVVSALSRLHPEQILAFHPIKSPQIRVVFERNPLLLAPAPTSGGCSLSPINTYVATSCKQGRSLGANDPCGKLKPRCSVPEVRPLRIAAVHILGFAATTRRLPACIQHADADTHYHTPVRVDRWTHLTNGETSLLQTFKLVLRDAISRGVYPFVILEEDFMVHRDICTKWDDISPHCTQSAEDGILMLGHTMYTQAAWDFFDESNTCHDLHKFAYGMFANVYSQRGAETMLNWLDSLDDLIPADHLYASLINSGIPVRALSPPLVVADVNRSSTVDPARKSNGLSVQERHAIHHWGDRNMFYFELDTAPAMASEPLT